MPIMVAAGQNIVNSIALDTATSRDMGDFDNAIERRIASGWYDGAPQCKELLLTSANRKALYSQLRPEQISSLRIDIEYIRERAKEDFASSRRQQIDQAPLRPFEHYKNIGFSLEINSDYFDELRGYIATQPEEPLLPRINNAKALGNRSVAPASTTWIAVGHDLLDHGVFFKLIEDGGITKKYRKLLDKLGNPLETDIFSYKAEVLSTIMFGWRDSHFDYTHHALEHDAEEMRQLLLAGINKINVSDNVLSAMGILSSINPQSIEEQRMSAVWNGELLMLDFTQKRKYGPIYELDPANNHAPVGEFNFRDPEFVAFVVECVAILLENEDLIETAALNASLITEQYLRDVLNEPTLIGAPLTIKPQELLLPLDMNKITLTKDVQNWFGRNLWHSVDWRERVQLPNKAPSLKRNFS